MVASVVLLHRAPVWIAPVYVAGAALTAMLYVRDKHAAIAGEWRVRESTLHAADFAFGIIGGLLAQEVLRHKTSKVSFAQQTAVITALHATGLAALLLFGG